jgi:hypothetical protein
LLFTFIVLATSLVPQPAAPRSLAALCPGPGGFGYTCAGGGASFTPGVTDLGNQRADVMTPIALAARAVAGRKR